MKMAWASFLAVLVIAALFGAAYLLSSLGVGHRGIVPSWEHLVSPGELTAAHSFLEDQCTACHEPNTGVTRTQCVACHANAESLLERQPTAFHADVNTCVPCHLEHSGRSNLVPPMDHAAMADIGLNTLMEDTAPDGEARLLGERLESWMAQEDSILANPRLGRDEATLSCETCHGNDDRHFDLFGSSCAECHETGSWTLPEFRHPSSASQDCSQCHQAPPSHYMGHFMMISQGVAGQHSASVDQCFACHQTTSWIDIQRIGIYQHH